MDSQEAGPPAAGQGDALMPAELTVVVPTYNERENAPLVVAGLARALEGIAWEVVFVDDDSPDGTAAAIGELARGDERVRLIHRVGRRGLSSACIEGMLSSSAPFVAVMDADLQHDESRLPEMLEALKSGGAEVAIGTRYMEGGGTGDWAEGRRRLSSFATWLSDLSLGTGVRDPMSGFFALRRPVLNEAVHQLSGRGFKILLDLIMTLRTIRGSAPRFAEIPYRMRSRQLGESKLDTMAAYEFLILLLDKRLGRFIPVRFALFGVSGLAGAMLHLWLLYALFIIYQAPFGRSLAMATLAAMVCNFLINNRLTYRDRRYRGWRMLPALLKFLLACSIGAVTNVALALFLFTEWQVVWWASALAGSVIGSVWNFAISSTYVWNRRR
jgi:dolichol-phosphate mannosyltransferase